MLKKSLISCLIFAATLLSFWVIKSIIIFFQLFDFNHSYNTNLFKLEMLSFSLYILIYLIIIGVCIAYKKLPFKYVFFPIMLSSIIIFYDFDKEKEVLNLMSEIYSAKISYESAYENSENGVLMLKSIKENNPKKFENILRDNDKNFKVNTIKENNLIEIVLQIFPSEKETLTYYLNDNYLSVYEYNKIRENILKIATKENFNLESEQLAMIRSL